MKISLPSKVDTDYTIETELGKILVPASYVPPVDGLDLDVVLIEKMVASARQARERAYVPIVDFKVGAAVVMADDPDEQIFTATNVDSAISGLGICAERNAVFTAISAGFRKIKYVVVATEAEGADIAGRSPCGACRQIISEFCLDSDADEGDTLVFIADSDETIIAEVMDIDRLLPHRYRFTAK